jgi:hypothetical protein
MRFGELGRLLRCVETLDVAIEEVTPGSRRWLLGTSRLAI